MRNDVHHSEIFRFCPTSSLKPRDVQFKMILNREKQQIFTVEQLETENVLDCLSSVIRIVGRSPSVDPFIEHFSALYKIISGVRFSKRETEIEGLSSFSHINDALYFSHSFCDRPVCLRCQLRLVRVKLYCKQVTRFCLHVAQPVNLS